MLLPGSRRFWILLVIVLAGVLLLVRANSTVLVNSYPRMDSYRVIEQRTIAVTVAVAPRSWTRVTNVAETPTEVRVKVESLDWPIPLPGTADLDLRDLTVSLADDLGARVVRDANGQAIPSR